MYFIYFRSPLKHKLLIVRYSFQDLPFLQMEKDWKSYLFHNFHLSQQDLMILAKIFFFKENIKVIVYFFF